MIAVSFALRASVLPAFLLLSCAQPAFEPWTPRLAADPTSPPTASREPDAPPRPAAAVQLSPGIAPLPLASCGDTEEGFAAWLVSFRRYAIEQGISARTVSLTLGAIPYNGAVIELDRSQKAFKLTFEQFSAKHLTRALVAQGKRQMQEQAELLAKIEEKFGVPPAILVAIWGLETSYGRDTGRMSAIRSLATLAYDCRRAERFRAELLSALRIADRGDLSPDEMVGAWAGELGQTQFLPSSYEKFAIDFDGDGHADLIRSAPDALASTANYLQGHGWRAHEKYQAGSPNFETLREWNKSEVYRKTIVLFATKLAR